MSDSPPSVVADARQSRDRRRSTLRALLWGSFHRRRLGPRRRDDRGIAAVDWHHPKWLAVGILILVLSVTDAFLTITLIQLGARELNPIMEPLVMGSGPGFALWKVGLTAGGVVLLILLARFNVFGRLPVSLILYAVLAIYVVLVIYELWLLERLSGGVSRFFME